MAATTYQIFLSFFIVILPVVVFISSIVYHKKRLKHILGIEDAQELKQSKYLVNTYLALASSLFMLLTTILTLLIIELFPYDYLSYGNLIVDIFLVSIIVVLIGVFIL